MKACKICSGAFNPLPSYRSEARVELNPECLKALFCQYIIQLGMVLFDDYLPSILTTKIRESLMDTVQVLIHNKFMPQTHLIPFKDFEEMHMSHFTSSLRTFAIRTYLTHVNLVEEN